MWLARDFLARHSRPVDVPPCTCPQCPPIEEPEMTTTPTPTDLDLNTDPTGYVILTETQPDFTEPGTWAPDWDGLLHATLDAAMAEEDVARKTSRTRLVACYHVDVVPSLLDELATYKAEVKHADAEREEAERNRDAAREELAKTRAELAKAQQMEAMAGRHAQQRDADLRDAEVTIQRLKTRLAEGDARWSRHMADEHPIEADANPATTAEPADERPIAARWPRIPGNDTVALHDCGGDPKCCGTPGDHAAAEPADEPWRDFTIHTDWGNEQDVYVACRLDDVCEEVKHNPDGTLLTLGEAVDWAQKHAASPFHAEPTAS